MKQRAVAKTFKATLERKPGNLGWTVIRIPFVVEKVWGTRGHVRVKGEINGFPLKAMVFPTRSGTHFLLVRKEVQRGSGAYPGTVAKFRIEPDFARRKVSMPPELARVLKRSRAIAKFFSELTPSARNEIARHIALQKTPAGRKRHAEKLAEHLLETLEAERELPPMIRRAFDANPKAWQGWRSMTPKQRRHELLSITYYRSPEAREKRLAKVIAWALKRAEKHDVAD